MPLGETPRLQGMPLGAWLQRHYGHTVVKVGDVRQAKDSGEMWYCTTDDVLGLDVQPVEAT